ncbi:MAG: alpha/beta hydrolase [Bacteroidia bacterium]|nr:alpha/beta hydrolase [Bacteroidia bacterium]
METLTISILLTVLSFLTYTQEGDKNQVSVPRMEIYKTIGDVKVYLYIFNPPDFRSDDKRPAIVFFHGGGFKANPAGGTSNFRLQSEYLASRGMVAIDAQYRGLPDFKVPEGLNDAQSAIRWVRTNAKRLGIDPGRIASSGGSAGGLLAEVTATVAAIAENGEDTTISCMPNALVLFNPVLALSTSRNSPYVHHIRPGMPPTIILHGKDDKTVPYASSEKFTAVMKEAGNRCELIGFEGAVHAFYNWNPDNPERRKFYVGTLREVDKFIASLGWIKGEPTIDH